MARCFHEAAVAGKETALRADLPGNGSVAVRPDDDLAAVTHRGSVGFDRRILPDIGGLRIGDGGVPALIVAAHENRAASRRPRGIHHGVIRQADPAAQDLDLPAPAVAPRGGYRPGNESRPRPALQLDFPACGPVGGCDAVLAQGEALAGLEIYLAVFPHHGAVGLHDPLLVDQSAVDPHPAALGNYLTQV